MEPEAEDVVPAELVSPDELVRPEADAVRLVPAQVEPDSTRPAPNAARSDDALSEVERAMQRQEAMGGAVASVFLGCWSLLFAWLTATAAINGLLGVFFGLWGMRSGHRRIAAAGIGLSVAGLFLTAYRVWVGNVW